MQDGSGPLMPASPTALLRDADGDGYYNDEDCDDTNPMVTPMRRICDGFDNNCDGQIDEAF